MNQMIDDRDFPPARAAQAGFWFCGGDALTLAVPLRGKWRDTVEPKGVLF